MAGSRRFAPGDPANGTGPFGAAHRRISRMNAHRTFRLMDSIVPRMIVGFTLLCWALLLAFAWIVLRQPEMALIPLLGLYPGKASAAYVDYDAEQIWATGSGLVFMALVFFGLFRKSSVAAIAFMLLFCISIGSWLLRLGLNVSAGH